MLHGKGDKATTRGFHPSATDALARWMDTRKALGIRRGPLFCTLNGSQMDAAVRAGTLLHRLGAKAGIDKRVHPHGLRHTFAVRAGAGRDAGHGHLASCSATPRSR